MTEAARVELEIQVLGGFQVRVNGVDVPDEAWTRRNAAAILKILALSPGHRLHREQMMEHLWPEADPRQVANNLYQAMHAARRALDTTGHDVGHSLRLHDQVIRFDSGVRLVVDADDFEQAVTATRTGGNETSLRAAAGLYQGMLLPDDLYEPWAFEPREKLNQQYLDVLEALAALQEASADYAGTLATLRQVVAAEPLHESAHRAMMRVHAASGQRQQAVRVYQTLKELLARELDIEPEPESRELYRQILAGEMAPEIVLPGVQAATAGRTDNLPSSLNSFIGREREMAEVRRLLRTTRLLTLTGPGGCGKSRLSLEVAAGEVGSRRGGVWLVELAALSNPDFIPQAITQAIGIHEMPGQQVIETVGAWLRSREVLLVLDNCEHMIDACAAIVEALLRISPGLTVLATSREPLRIDGETTSLVPSLSLPDPSEPQSAEELLQYEAVQLFVDRATRVAPGFGLTADTGMQVAELCYRLDGIPLAIELAASRVRAMPVEQIVERLSDRFQLLSGGSRTALSRQQTLRATLDWSYNLLSERERVLFARLSVFSGGFTLQAVEEICAAPPLEQAEIIDVLMLLVDRSLVVATLSDGAARYTLLETMREYGRERLAEAGGTEAIGAAHAGYFADLAQVAAGKIRGVDQRAWLQMLDREHDNLRRALDWFEERATSGALEDALLLAGNLHWFWHLRGHYTEGRRRLARLLDIDRPGTSPGLGSALTGAGTMFMVVGEYAEATAYLRESIEVWHEQDDPGGLSAALSWSGWIELFHGSIAVARERHTEALELAERVDDDWGIAMALLSLGIDAVEADEHERAFSYFERSLSLYRSINDYWGTTTTLQLLANLTYRTGDFSAARQLAQEVVALERAEGGRWLEVQSQSLLGEIARAEGDYHAAAASVEVSLEIASEIGHVASRAWTLRDAGYISLARGEPDQAVRHLMESLAIFQDRSFPLGIVCCLGGLAGVLIHKGRYGQAAELLGTITSVLSALHMSFAPADRLAVEGFIAVARNRLGDSAFETAWKQGMSRSLEDFVQQIEMFFGAK